MSPVTVSLARGSVNLSNRSATFNPMRLRAPYLRDSAIDTGRRHGGSVWHPAAATKTEKGFFVFRVDQEEHTVIMIDGRSTRNGVPYSDACLFVRLRNSAPMLAINMTLPVSSATLLGDSFTVFSGRGDILSQDELRILGYAVPPKFFEMRCRQEEIDELFTVRTIGQGTAKPVIQATTLPSGEVHVITTVERPVRGIRRRS